MIQNFELVFLGVGNGLCPELGNNNVLLGTDEFRHSLLIDCGSLTPLRLLEMGRFPSIEHILITHVHADHVGGLELLALLNRYSYRKRPHLYFHEDLWEELWMGTLRGGLERSQDEKGNPSVLTLADYFEVHLLKGDGARVEIPFLPTVTVVPTVHVKGKPSYSLFLGDRVYYSADSQLLPPSKGPSGKDLTAIFQDCQVGGGPFNVHTTFEQLKMMPPEKKAITRLMHYCTEFGKTDALSAGFEGFVCRGETYQFVFE